MTDQIALQAQGLTRRYGARMAVDDLSFTLNKGEVVGLLGVNGAGKSSTMNMLAGIMKPDQGHVLINQQDIYQHPKTTRAQIGYLPEVPPLYPELTVDNYLRYAAKLRLIPADQLDERLAVTKQRCGLADHGKRLIRNLSKGYQQRVGIAQAIIHSPDIVILDEPTVGLDPVQIREIRSLIKELGEQHCVLLSTHILPEVQTVCDRVLIMNKGRILHEADITSFNEEGSLESIFIRISCGEESTAA